MSEQLATVRELVLVPALKMAGSKPNALTVASCALIVLMTYRMIAML